MVVESFNLLVSSNGQFCLVSFNTTIRIVFNFVYPFIMDGSLSWRKLHNSLSLIQSEGLNFFSYGFAPIAVFHYFMIESSLHNLSDSNKIISMYIREFIASNIIYDAIRTTRGNLFEWTWKGLLDDVVQHT